MPPKVARGRGAARAQGASRSQGTANDATPPTTDSAPLLDRPSGTVVPVQDGNSDTKIVGSEISGNDQENLAESSSRPPVQRIGSLQGSVPPSRSASPSVRGRGSAARGKRGTVKPTFTGRRTKEEREALAKELKEREELRNAERNAANEKKDREAKFKKKREETRLQRARGGYSGAVSGPFSLGSSAQDKKRNAGRGLSGFGSGSGSRAVRVKNEGDGHGGGSGSYSGGGGGGGRTSIKREDGEYVSSEEEDDGEFPRRDIDLIEISSDENEEKDVAAPSRRGPRTTLPVRIGRKEHQERTVALNTDASSETAAKILEKTEAPGEMAARTTSGPASHNNKGKGKAKDVEITGEKTPFRGVWQDEDDSGFPVKVETLSDDEVMADAEPLGLGEPPRVAAEKQEPASPKAERKPNVRANRATEPILQTDEDRAEWARFQSNLHSIRAELGPDETPAADAPGGDSSTAGDGAGAATKKPTVRDNNVYLFQIPPLMPDLVSPSVQGEPVEAPASTTVAAKADPKVKLEEGTFSDPSAKTQEAPRFASGLVGKLRVRQSGRTTLDWGGTSYELMPGNKASFLQEVVSMQIVPDAKRVVPEDAGEAISMGRVKGKFVVVPDWGAMLG